MLYSESMHYFFTIFFVVFGSLLGSFCNVVVLRMAISRSVIFPPSACPKCNHQLHAKDLVPVLSWLFLRGKCRYCQAPISIQYPLGEFFMAIIIGFSFFKTGPGLPLICLASSMAIWFVVSEIFIRGEVLKHQPFIWAVVYSIGLKYLLVGKEMFDLNFILIAALSVLVGLLASIKSNAVEFTRWAFVAFLPLLHLPIRFLPYIAAVLLLTSFLNFSKKYSKHVKWVFFIFQLVAILLNIYFTNTSIVFIEYIG